MHTNHSRWTRGFTIIELLVVIVVISILAGITIIGYGAWRQSAARTAVENDLTHATSGLESYRNFKNDYPPNLAGTNFAGSNDVALKLSTNSPQTRTYSGLTADQNAQLLLNSCNANMPITDGSTTYNTACAFAGNNVHVPGSGGSNVLLHGPTINASDFALTCGSACDAAVAAIKADFAAQGGSWPISVPKNQVALPEPTLTSYGSASKFCLQGTSALYSDVVYHTTNSSTAVVDGPCPNDPELHYP